MLVAQMTKELQRTPIEAVHLELGAKMVEFGGWYMPVQYSSIMDEHGAVRTKCGVFDISHMGQMIVSGEGAEAYLNRLLTNDVTKLVDGVGQYTLMLNEKGGVIDDLILYREVTGKYFLVVNASMIAEDFAWMFEQLGDSADVQITNESTHWAGMAVQGPESAAVFAGIFPDVALPQRNGILRFSHDGQELVVCRTGYTGEDGWEFFCASGAGGEWLMRFVNAGAKPCGLGARDSLRLEMCYPLNGNDLSPERTPLEAGLGVFVSLEKGPFVGSEKLVTQKKLGLEQRLVAIAYTEKGAPPRSHYAVENASGEVIGELSSGIMSPSLMQGIALAYLPMAYTKLGTVLFIDVRGRKFPAKVVKKPFYKA